jgi:hypothetical protein
MSTFLAKRAALALAATSLFIGAAYAQSASVRERANVSLQSRCMQTAVELVPGHRGDEGIADNRVWAYLSCMSNNGNVAGR